MKPKGVTNTGAAIFEGDNTFVTIKPTWHMDGGAMILTFVAVVARGGHKQEGKELDTYPQAYDWAKSIVEGA